jgi:hypothetical protein
MQEAWALVAPALVDSSMGGFAQFWRSRALAQGLWLARLQKAPGRGASGAYSRRAV